MLPTLAARTADPPAAAAPSQDRRLLLIGILGAVVAFLGLSVLAALTIKPFLPADESPNAGYAISVSQGRLPRVDERVVPQVPKQRSVGVQYVANHPPLYFLLAGVPLRLGLEGGYPEPGFYAARLLTVLLSAGTVALTGVFAAVLARRGGPAVAVGAAALVATSAALVLHAGIIHNDGLATGLVTAELVATVLVLRQGLRTGACLLLVASASLALLTRISAVSLVALSAAALVAAGLLHPVGGWRRTILRSVAWVGALAAVCASTSGWFYWRNVRLYGDPTARGYVVDLLRARPGWHRPPASSFADVILSPDTYWRQVLRMSGAYGEHGLPLEVIGPARWAIAATWLAVGAGIVVFGARLVRARRWSAADGRLLVEGTVAAVLTLHVVAVFLQIANHVSQGGAANARYLFPAWPVVAAVMAYCIAGLAGRLGRVLLVLAVVAQAALTVAWLSGYAVKWTKGPGLLAEVPKAVRLSGAPAPDVVLALLAVLVIGGLGAAVTTILWGGGHAPAGDDGRHLPARDREARPESSQPTATTAEGPSGDEVQVTRS